MNLPLQTELRIRRMIPADLDPVIRLADSLEQAPHWTRSAYLAALNSEAAPPRIALVADAPETTTIHGFAVASLMPPQAELESIAVASEGQRQGIARQIFSALAQELETAQIAELLLEVRASNYPALAFYRAVGFIETGRRPRYYADPIEDAVLMKLHLA
jgi:ribosomal-protein-alanine N-acetyltransferase